MSSLPHCRNNDLDALSWQRDADHSSLDHQLSVDMEWSVCLCSLLVVLLACMVVVAHTSFSVGKVPATTFDLVELNGYYYPADAVVSCDSHPTCAGFTYRGLFNFSSFPDKKYETYFFRYVSSISKDAEFSNWVSYKTKKLFAEYHGLFNGQANTVNEKTDDYTDMCNSPNCAALTVYTHSGMIREKFVAIDLSMDDFVPSEDIKTLFNFEVEEESVRDTATQLDLCCPAHNRSFDVSQFIHTVNDTLPRVSCDISVEEFARRFIIPREPVMLTGCIDDWYATKMWTFEGMMKRYGEDITWKVMAKQSYGSNVTTDDYNKEIHQVDVSLDKDSPVSEHSFLDLDPDEEFENEREVRSYEHLSLSGKRILELINLNATVRIFERVGTPPNREQFFNLTGTRKPDLFNEWKWPNVFPEDLYKPTMGGSDYQWVIMSQKATGTHVHHDPAMTDAWNALLTGHKYWAILPKDVYAGNYECDMRCSPEFDELYAVSWYTHILPQLRKETWYGKGVIETIQKPGEIIFVPNGQGHSVLNLDENLSITENFLSIAAIDEVAQFYAYGWNPLSYDYEDAAKRVWINLMNRDLKDSQVKKYAKEMLKQARTIDATQFDVPYSLDYTY